MIGGADLVAAHVVTRISPKRLAFRATGSTGVVIVGSKRGATTCGNSGCSIGKTDKGQRVDRRQRLAGEVSPLRNKCAQMHSPGSSAEFLLPAARRHVRLQRSLLW